MWTHVKPTYDLVEQWIARKGGLSVCSLRRDQDGWAASLLNFGGISTTQMHLTSKLSLEQAQAECDKELKRMGYVE